MSKMEVVGRAAHKTVFIFKKHLPTIMMIGGGVGTVASTVMACKATLKANDILEEAHSDMEKVETARETCDEEKYSEKDYKKDKTLVYFQTAVKFAKLYGPSVMVGTMSLGCMFGSHTIMKKRNAAIAAAFAVSNKSFKEYRDRVIERFGKDVEHEIRHNIKAKEFDEKEVDSETGEEKVVGKKSVNVADPNTFSEYARFFDDGCMGWTKDPESNLTFLKQQQNWANNRLKSVGYLYLNEVYDALGIPKTKAGQIVGWVYDEKNPIGDNFVDFGLYNIDVERVRDFVNGYERTILLDFNVDGNILDLM